MSHAAIDGCPWLLREHKFQFDAVQRIALTLCPAALEFGGNPEPQTGLAAKFSVRHAAALALVDDEVNHDQFTDELAREPKLVALRRKVKTVADPALGKEQAKVAIQVKGGRAPAPRLPVIDPEPLSVQSDMGSFASLPSVRWRMPGARGAERRRPQRSGSIVTVSVPL